MPPARPLLFFFFLRQESISRETAVIADNARLHASKDTTNPQELLNGEGEHAAPVTGGEKLPDVSSPFAGAAGAAGSSNIPRQVTPADAVNTNAPSGDSGGDGAADGSGGSTERQVSLLPAIGSLRSSRSPSTTLAWLLVMQVQFLAVLSLVDSVGSGRSFLSDFLRHLR